ncbi:heme biosynthesis protein HemY [Kineococcus indalonis]|uniref:heme biosynthesis protein HemY n=1 Tax=Kineococcus indalonis TaxID=2696566 RepID=UPI00141357A1|nr:heme biosynthesis protein HemY [Kineococcus indalonis]NAZ84559.1 heme biosynthesis protein HemY [Kineococcus indalonis]
MSGQQEAEDPGARGAPDPRQRYRTLPEPVPLDRTIEGQRSRPVPDPAAGRDPDRDAVLRHPG